MYQIEKDYMNTMRVCFSFEMFCQVMDQCTENYECLVINNNAKSNKLTDQVFWYKAEQRPDYRIGADSYWTYSAQNYSTEERVDEDQFGGKKKILLMFRNYTNSLVASKIPSLDLL